MKRTLLLLGLAAIVVVHGYQVRSARDAHDLSDRFWGRFGLARASWGEHYPSLSALADGAHLIIRGRIVDVSEGRIFVDEGGDSPDGTVRFAELAVRVEEVIRADSRLQVPGIVRLEVFMRSANFVEVSAHQLPSEEATFFMSNRGLAAADDGFGEGVQAARASYYQQLNDIGVFRRIEGRVHRPVGGDEPWLDEIDGLPYDQFVDMVGTAVATQ